MRTIHDARYRQFIARLRDARQALGMTQSQACRTLGWSRVTLSNVETCERRLDLLEADPLCLVYGLHMSDLEALLDDD